MKFCVVGDNLIALDLVEFLLTQENDVYWLTQGDFVDGPANKRLHILPFSYEELGALGSMDYFLLVGDRDEENILRASLCKKNGEGTVMVLIQDHDLAQSQVRDLFPYIDDYFYPGRNLADEIVNFAVEEGGLPQRRYLHPKLDIWTYTLERDHPILGKPLKDLSLDRTLVVTIYRDGDFFVPRGNTLLKEGDRLYLLGSGSMEVFRRKDSFFAPKGQRKKFWILGASLDAKNLALSLMDRDFDVDISLPRGEDLRAWRLALPKAYIKEEDLTSLETFSNVNPQDYQGVICASREDNDNVLMAILAGQVGFLKTFCLINHKDYAKATEKVVVGLQLNPRAMTASSLFTMIHQPGKIHITPLPGATTEVLELELLKDSPLVGKSLKEISLKEGVIVGAVLRHRQLIIPSGELIFQGEDSLIIFAKSSLRDQLLKRIYKSEQVSLLKKWIGGQE